MEAPHSLDLHWKGPFVWPGVGLQALPNLLDDADIAMSCGIYLKTVEHAMRILDL